MKTISLFKTRLLQATFISATLLGTSACENSSKAKDTKEVAEEYNEAKFDDTKREDDAQFLVNAAEINLEEIALGQLAQKNSTMSEVKELGKMMESAHTSSLNDLNALAKKKIITIPTSATDDAKDAYKKLGKKSGSDFDKKYCDMMVEGHKDAISKFEKASTKSNDPEIKAWAVSMLPELRKHLDQAITCQKKCEKYN
jgi:putative membrane protein